MKSSLFFSSVDCAFIVASKHYLPSTKSHRFLSPLFSSRSVIVLALKFKPVIYFDFILGDDVSQVLNSLFFAYRYPIVQA